MLAATYAFLTEATCGEACWHAREEICRCSCGGKNHGILCSANGEQPIRQSKIDGYRYELLAVGAGKELSGQCAEIFKTLEPRDTQTVTATSFDDDGNRIDTPLVYTYRWTPTEAGSPYRLKKATPQQCSKWSELSQFEKMEVQEFYQTDPCLLWKRVDNA